MGKPILPVSQSTSPKRTRSSAEATSSEPRDPDEVLRHGLNVAHRTLMRIGACRIEDAEDLAQEIGMSFVKRRAEILCQMKWTPSHEVPHLPRPALALHNEEGAGFPRCDRASLPDPRLDHSRRGGIDRQRRRKVR